MCLSQGKEYALDTSEGWRRTGLLRKPAEVTGGKALLRIATKKGTALMCLKDKNFARESMHFILR